MVGGEANASHSYTTIFCTSLVDLPFERKRRDFAVSLLDMERGNTYRLSIFDLADDHAVQLTFG
jgi:hypothetical protein